MCVALALLACIVTCIGVLLCPADASAQLRPLDPLEWRALASDGQAFAAAGVGILSAQRASLAGTRGTLLELGNWLIAYRSGRIALEFGGTAVRRFEDDERLAPPAAAAGEPANGVRVDAGDVRIGTILRLLGSVDRHVVALRFGTRLPTPSDEPGLDRDRTDFYATAAGRTRVAAGLRLFGEAGVGIHSTIIDHYPQSDVLVYAAGIEQRWSGGGVRAGVVGHDDLHERVIRGNEDLSELRVTGWLGRARWIEATVVRGIAEFSPRWGVLVRAGARLW
jgi:hypothetical protein